MEADIKSMYLPELQELCVSMGEKAFRGKQLFSWLHRQRVESYKEMTNLPEKLRKKLEEEYPIVRLRPVRVQVSKIDGTR